MALDSAGGPYCQLVVNELASAFWLKAERITAEVDTWVLGVYRKSTSWHCGYGMGGRATVLLVCRFGFGVGVFEVGFGGDQELLFEVGELVLGV